MDKNKKKIIQFWAVASVPIVVTLILLVLKIAVWRSMPVLVVILPVLVPLMTTVAVFAVFGIAYLRYHSLHDRKCCGTCVHCSEDVYAKKGKCLSDGKEIKHPARMCCEKFYGSVTKGYTGRFD